MARYSVQQKELTRRRILDASARRIKADGFTGAGVTQLMKDAGLTNGAFYAHFTSKNDLLVNVLRAQLDHQRATAETYESGAGAAAAFVRSYLSTAHRDQPAEGCPSAALLDEIVRGDETVRRVYTDGILAVMDVVSGWLLPARPWATREAVLTVFAGMVGTLQMARVMTEPHLSDALLDQGISRALTQLGIEDA